MNNIEVKINGKEVRITKGSASMIICLLLILIIAPKAVSQGLCICDLENACLDFDEAQCYLNNCPSGWVYSPIGDHSCYLSDSEEHVCCCFVSTTTILTTTSTTLPCSEYCLEKYGVTSEWICIDAVSWWNDIHPITPDWQTAVRDPKNPLPIDTGICPPAGHPEGICLNSVQCCLTADSSFSATRSYWTDACEGEGPGGEGVCCIYNCAYDDECPDDGIACNGEEICSLSSHTCTHSNPMSCADDGEVCTGDGCRSRPVNEYTCDIHPYSPRRGSPCIEDDCFCSDRVCEANGYEWSGKPSPLGCGGNDVCCCGTGPCSSYGGMCLPAGIGCGVIEQDNDECWISDCCEGAIDRDCAICKDPCEDLCSGSGEYLESCMYFSDINDFECWCTPLAPDCSSRCGNGLNLGWDLCDEGELCCMGGVSTTSSSSSTLTTLGCEYCGEVEIYDYPRTIYGWMPFEINYSYRGSGVSTDYPYDVRKLLIDGTLAHLSMPYYPHTDCMINDTSDCTELQDTFVTRCPPGETGDHDFNITCMAVGSDSQSYCGEGYDEESSDTVTIECVFGLLKDYALIFNVSSYSPIADCEPHMWWQETTDVWHKIDLDNCLTYNPPELVDHCIKPQDFIVDQFNTITLINVTCPITYMWNIWCENDVGMTAFASDNWTFKTYCPEMLLSNELNANCILCQQNGFIFSGNQFGCGGSMFGFNSVAGHIPDCCGNDANEFYIQEKFGDGMTGIASGGACCSAIDECVDDVCYPIGTLRDANEDGNDDVCGDAGVWNDCDPGISGTCGAGYICDAGVCVNVENTVCYTGSSASGYDYCTDSFSDLCSAGGFVASSSCTDICSDIGLSCLNGFNVIPSGSINTCSTPSDDPSGSSVVRLGCGGTITNGFAHCYCIDPIVDPDSSCEVCTGAFLEYNGSCSSLEITFFGGPGSSNNCCGDDEASEKYMSFNHAKSPKNYNPCDKGNCTDQTLYCSDSDKKCVFDGELYINAELNSRARPGDFNSPIDGWADVNQDGIYGEYCGVDNAVGAWMDVDGHWFNCEDLGGFIWIKEGEDRLGNLPGEYARRSIECCGDDTNEDYWHFKPFIGLSYPEKEFDPCDKPGFSCSEDTSDEACCKLPSQGLHDGVYSNKCYTGSDFGGERRRKSNDQQRGYADIDGDGVVGALALSDGLWYDCDGNETLCGRMYCDYSWVLEGETAGGGSYPGEYDSNPGGDGTLLECCGDDQGEYYIDSMSSCDGTEACCNNEYDTVLGGICVNSC